MELVPGFENYGFKAPARQTGLPVHSFRSLFDENRMHAKWQFFATEVLRDIIDSQSNFQISLERSEVRYFVYCIMMCIYPTFICL